MLPGASEQNGRTQAHGDQESHLTGHGGEVGAIPQNGLF